MTQETYDEICEYFTLANDTSEGDDRALTFRGFYELQVAPSAPRPTAVGSDNI